MKTMKDYHDMYLKCGVLLLADIFEKSRNNSIKNCGLYLSYYFENTILKLGCHASYDKCEAHPRS